MSIDITIKNFSNYTKRLQKTLAKELGASTPLSLSQCSELLAKTLGFNTRHDLNKVLSTPVKDDEFQLFEDHRLSIENEVNNYLKKNPNSLFGSIEWFSSSIQNKKEIFLRFELLRFSDKTVSFKILNEIQVNDFDLTEQDRDFILHLKKKFKRKNDFNENFNLYIHHTYHLSESEYSILGLGTSAYAEHPEHGPGVAKRSHWLIPKTQLDDIEKNIVERDGWYLIQYDNTLSPAFKVDNLIEGLSNIQKNQDLMLIQMYEFDSGSKFGLYTFYNNENQIFMCAHNSKGARKVPIDYLNIESRLYIAYLWGCSDYMLGDHQLTPLFTDKSLNSFYLKGYLHAKSWYIKQPRF